MKTACDGANMNCNGFPIKQNTSNFAMILINVYNVPNIIQINDVCFVHLLTKVVLSSRDRRLWTSLRRIEILMIVAMNANDDSNPNS